MYIQPELNSTKNWLLKNNFLLENHIEKKKKGVKFKQKFLGRVGVWLQHTESTWIQPWKRQDSHMSPGLIGLDS